MVVVKHRAPITPEAIDTLRNDLKTGAEFYGATYDGRQVEIAEG